MSTSTPPLPPSWNLDTCNKRHASAIRRDANRWGWSRANIPTSWQKLTQAQMYLTNSPPLLCMFKCEPDGSEQWSLARCLIVCGGYRRGTLELIRVGGAGSLQKGPQILLSLTMIQWFNSFQHQSLPTHWRAINTGWLGFVLFPLPTVS